jgi:hypothetical protein
MSFKGHRYIHVGGCFRTKELEASRITFTETYPRMRGKWVHYFIQTCMILVVAVKFQESCCTACLVALDFIMLKSWLCMFQLLQSAVSLS